ncbi:MAG: hypothetical protein ACBZ72_05100 [Candidatus Bathyarchaeia archaeon]
MKKVETNFLRKGGEKNVYGETEIGHKIAINNGKTAFIEIEKIKRRAG